MSRLFRKKVLFTLAALVLVVIMVAGCSSPDSDPSNGDDEIMEEIVFATGPVGGSWYPIGTAAGDIWADELGILTHVELGGGEANIRGVNAGQYDLGLSHSFAAVNAAQGIGPFEGDPHTNVSGLAVLFPNVQQQVVWANSNIYTVQDMVGTVISPGPSGFGGETLASWILDFYGLDYSDMGGVEHVGYSDAIALMKDRHVDVFWPNTLTPAPSITELALLGPGVRIVELGDDVIEHLENRNPGLMRFTIPKDAYRGMEKDTETITTFTIIIVRSDLPEATVYAITKSLIENNKRLLDVSAALEAFTSETAPFGVGVPLHPGAERYYKEIGVLD